MPASEKKQLPDSGIDESFLETERRLVRKLDSTLMPTVFTLYLFNYLDRNNIAYVIYPSHCSHYLTSLELKSSQT